MTTLGLEVGIFVVLTIEVSAQVVVVLVEEVSLTDTNPEELGVLGQEVVDLRVAVCIDLGMTIRIGLVLIDSCREETYIVEQIRIVDGDEEAVETTH